MYKCPAQSPSLARASADVRILALQICSRQHTRSNLGDATAFKAPPLIVHIVNFQLHIAMCFLHLYPN